jgi:hypothetical protein
MTYRHISLVRMVLRTYQQDQQTKTSVCFQIRFCGSSHRARTNVRRTTSEKYASPQLNANTTNRRISGTNFPEEK